MAYNRINWENAPSTATPLDADNLNRMDAKIADLDTSMDAVQEGYNEMGNEMDLVNARIDTFTNLPEGSTTGDAELADARIGADGVTYNTLGQAVRTQFTNLNNKTATDTTPTYGSTKPVQSSGTYTAIQNVITKLAPAFSESVTYSIGDYCTYDDKIYRAKAAITSGNDFVSGYWTELSSISAIIKEMRNIVTDTEVVIGNSYPAGTFLVYDGVLYEAISDNAPFNGVGSSGWRGVRLDDIIARTNANFADQYTRKTYSVGDYCIQLGILYRANIDISTAEAFNASHWDQVSVTEVLGGLDEEVTSLKTDLTQIESNLTVSVFETAYNETFSEVPSINPVRIPYAFDFIEGKTYHFKIECINVSPLAETNQFMLDASTSDSPSISNIPEEIYRSGSSVNVYTGAILEFDYTPTRSDLHGFLLRYKTNIGIQNFSVDITTTGNFQKLQTDTSDGINSLQTQITNMTNVSLLSDAYNETFSEVPSINPVRIPYAFDFVEGKTYHFKIECVNISPLAETNQFLVDASTSDSPSTSNIPEVIYRSGSRINVHTGAILEFDYTPTRSDLHGFLLRYKTDIGVQNFTVDITTIENFQNIRNELQNMHDETDNIKALIPNQSRMQFGAHRGAESFAPPNSVAAYEIAGKMGFQWAWLAQIRWSASKTLYVMHDEDVSITTNGTGNISELTDEYIQSLLCNKLTTYDYSKFTNDDLRVPTLEKVIQICVKYGMKMCFRIEPFPSDMDSADNALIWNNFANLIKEYNIKDGIYSGYNAFELKLCRTLIGDDENLCPFTGNTTTGQDYINFFNNSNISGKRSVLLYYQNATFSDIKLLHKNGIEVYVFYNGTRPTQTEVEQWASWGVEILQNPNTPKLTIG